MPLSVRQAVGFDRLEPMTTAGLILLERVLLVTEPAKVVYCSISRPEAALDARFWQLSIVLPEILRVKKLMPVGA